MKNKENYIERCKLQNTGVTLVALVITIIILLILVGISIIQFTESGLLVRAKQAEERTRYMNAKEIITMKLMEIESDCIENNRDCTIEDIYVGMLEAQEITINKYYTLSTSKIKDGIESDINNIFGLKGIVVSVNDYPEYNFLIGDEGKIIGVKKDIKDTTEMEDFINLEEFEKNLFDGKISNETDEDYSMSVIKDIQGKVLSEIKNIKVKDNYNNIVVVPAKFKIKNSVKNVGERSNNYR